MLSTYEQSRISGPTRQEIAVAIVDHCGGRADCLQMLDITLASYEESEVTINEDRFSKALLELALWKHRIDTRLSSCRATVADQLDMFVRGIDESYGINLMVGIPPVSMKNLRIEDLCRVGTVRDTLVGLSERNKQTILRNTVGKLQQWLGNENLYHTDDLRGYYLACTNQKPEWQQIARQSQGRIAMEVVRGANRVGRLSYLVQLHEQLQGGTRERHTDIGSWFSIRTLVLECYHPTWDDALQRSHR